jgi:hypothetical protein
LLDSPSRLSIQNHRQKKYIWTITDLDWMLQKSRKKFMLKFTIDAFYVLFINCGQNGFLKSNVNVKPSVCVQVGIPMCDCKWLKCSLVFKYSAISGPYLKSTKGAL